MANGWRLQGTIKFGNFSNDPEVRPLKVVELTGDTEAIGGNWEFARVNTNGFAFVQSKAMRGLYLDGVKQDTYTRDVTEPLDKAVQILAALEVGGDDALAAYVAIVDLLQADTAPLMDLQEFVAAYSAAATDNLTYSANLLKKLAVSVQGQEWVDGKSNAEIFAAAQSFVRGHTRDQLLGLETELVRTLT